MLYVYLHPCIPKFSNFGAGVARGGGDAQGVCEKNLFVVDEFGDCSVGIAIKIHTPKVPLITIDGLYKPSKMGGLLLLYPHY